ncbi:MAG TPA: DEAD/DEAH box helicase [Bacillota bacterium]|nr:DEAD/DEAH box helicase [Bacillota bacterium]HPJ85383.1 DEAD/DEAH box helicase [Bacillota bacterium]
MKFSKPYLNDALASLGFDELTTIQKSVLEKAASKKSLVVESNTGTGKTHAYLLSIFERICEDADSVQAVIVVPTADLAKQTYKFAEKLAEFSKPKVNVMLFSGGSDRERDIASIKKNHPQIVVGTPGRLADLIRNENALVINKTLFFIIDEADMALDGGFLEDVDKIASSVGKDTQFMIFSATIPENIKPFLKKYIGNTEFLKDEINKENASLIQHVFVKTETDERMKKLDEVTLAINPYLAIVFCNTKKTAESVNQQLKDSGKSTVLFSGDVEFRKRRQIIDRIRRLEFQYVVSTDILSRGIDIESVSHVINYELPKETGFYIHRSGRTGRMGSDGVCVSLYTKEEMPLIEKLEAKGLKCDFRYVSDRELLPARRQNERNERKATDQKKTVRPKNLKVKPNYKAKFKQNSGIKQSSKIKK